MPGEVVFNTGMVGYPEALTDPSCRGRAAKPFKWTTGRGPAAGAARIRGRGRGPAAGAARIVRGGGVAAPGASWMGW